MAGHALLSPSSAGRWLKCTPSARLEVRKDDRAGDAADEGTLAHKVSEIMLKHALGLMTTKAYKVELKLYEQAKHYSDDMWEHCDQYKTFVMERFAEAQEADPNATIHLESQVDLTKWIPEGFGTRDVAIAQAGFVEIIDLKYGKGVQVDATENRQLMLYALGTLEEYDMVYDVEKVRMTIYQPRIENFSSWEIGAKELRRWAEKEVKPSAKLAWEGKGQLEAGDHCQFCRMKATCRAFADHAQEIARHDFAEPTELTDEELVEVMLGASKLINWVNAVKADMLRRSLADGKEWPGLKIVQGKSSRVITDPARVIKALSKAGIPKTDYMSQPALLGLTALKKNVGERELLRLAGKYVYKPPGKPALVNEDDPRPEWTPEADAIQAFAEMDETDD